MRAGLKRALEHLLLRGGVAGLARKHRRGQDLVLAYHNIVPTGERPRGDRSLHLPQLAFGEHLDRLVSDRVRVVPLATLLDPASAPVDGPPRVAITFDDAYVGALTAGVEELEARGLPATFFVAPGLLDGQAFWWDVLAETGELDERIRERALVEDQGRADRILGELSEQEEGEGSAGGSLPRHARSADEGALTAAAHVPGITFGSHTWTHPNLARLSPEECRRELEHSLTWLRSRFSNVEPWVAYPYGLHSPVVERVTRDTGHRAGFRITGGWLARRQLYAYAVPRLNVPAGLSGPGFSLRLAGLFCG